jgi:hypothetical protein
MRFNSSSWVNNVPSHNSSFLPIATARKQLQQAGFSIRSLAPLPFGQDIFAATRRGTSSKSILVAAGSHADEIAGVLAAVEVALAYDGPHTVHCIPFRDPLGWQGFNYIVSRDLALDGPPRLQTHEEARSFLHSYATPLFDDRDLIVARGNSMCFASRHYSDFVSSDLARYQLQNALSSQTIEEIKGTRILLPGSVARGPERGPFDWGGSTAYVGSDGWIGHFNRFFDRDDAPTEVRAVRTFVNEVQPDLSLDLHEGFGEAFYLFTPVQPDQTTLEIAEAMTGAVLADGGHISTSRDMSHVWRPEVAAVMVEHKPGIYSMERAVGPERATFNTVCSPFGPCITTEPGMNQSVTTRIGAIITATNAALQAFQRQETR